MIHLSIERARGRLASIARSCSEEPIQLTSRGRPVAVLVGSEHYAALLQPRAALDPHPSAIVHPTPHAEIPIEEHR